MMLDAVHAFTGLVVFAQVFTLGLLYKQHCLHELATAGPLLLRSLLSVLVVVPLAAMLLIATLPVPVEVAIGIALLAACPGAPLTTRRAMPSGADLSYVAAIQLLLAFLAVVFTPVTHFLFARVIDLPLPAATPALVAGQVGLVTFLPASLGWLVARFPGRAPRWVRSFVPRLAGLLWIALLAAAALALALVTELRGSLAIGWTGAIAVVLLAAVALAGGWALGFPSRVRRSGLAIATLARNIGLCLYVAEASPLSAPAVPTILAYMFMGMAFGFLFSRIVKRLL